MKIRVAGMDPNDWAPPHVPERPSRVLTANEVEHVKTTIANLKDVGWRPFFDEGKAWQAALDWSLAVINEALIVLPAPRKRSWLVTGRSNLHEWNGYEASRFSTEAKARAHAAYLEEEGCWDVRVVYNEVKP